MKSEVNLIEFFDGLERFGTPAISSLLLVIATGGLILYMLRGQGRLRKSTSIALVGASVTSLLGNALLSSTSAFTHELRILLPFLSAVTMSAALTWTSSHKERATSVAALSIAFTFFILQRRFLPAVSLGAEGQALGYVWLCEFLYSVATSCAVGMLIVHSLRTQNFLVLGTSALFFCFFLLILQCAQRLSFLQMAPCCLSNVQAGI